ncbi:MAG: DUF1616 domain-containing protein [Thermoplasmata archaeon]
MSGTPIYESLAGLALVFFLPGYCTTKALFPEWRVQGPDGLTRLVEIISLSFVLSVVLTIVLGYGLLVLGPNGFQASWSDPVLEAILAVIAAVALAAGILRHAYSKEAPLPRDEGADPGGEGAWELLRELEDLQREERRLRHRLRVTKGDSGTSAQVENQLRDVQEQIATLRQHREAEYAQ